MSSITDSPDPAQTWADFSSCCLAHHLGIRSAVACLDGFHTGCLASTTPGVRSMYFQDRQGPTTTFGFLVDGALYLRDSMGGVPASLHDSRVLHMSQLWRRMETDYDPDNPFIPVDKVVLADAAYPLTDWLMKPFLDAPGKKMDDTLSDLQCRAFNFVLSSARQVVEHFNARILDLTGALRTTGGRRTPDETRTLVQMAVAISNVTVMHELVVGGRGWGERFCRRQAAGRKMPAGPRLVRWDRKSPPSANDQVRIAKENRRTLARAVLAQQGDRLVLFGDHIMWREHTPGGHALPSVNALVAAELRNPDIARPRRWPSLVIRNDRDEDRALALDLAHQLGEVAQRSEASAAPSGLPSGGVHAAGVAPACVSEDESESESARDDVGHQARESGSGLLRSSRLGRGTRLQAYLDDRRGARRSRAARE